MFDEEEEDLALLQQYENEVKGDSDSSNELDSDTEDRLISIVQYSSNALPSRSLTGQPLEITTSEPQPTGVPKPASSPVVTSSKSHLPLATIDSSESETSDSDSDSDSEHSAAETFYDQSDSDDTRYESFVSDSDEVEDMPSTRHLDINLTTLDINEPTSSTTTDPKLNETLQKILDDTQYLQQDRLPRGRAPLICYVCGIPGHISGSCTRCLSCGERHTTRGCSMRAHCSNCKQRGHSNMECTNARTKDNCKYCGSRDHTAKSCMEVFSLYVSNGEGVPMSRHAPRYCYNCSNEGHFGDDCPTLPGHLQASPTSFRAALMSNTGKPIKRSRSPTPPRPHKHGRRSYPSDSEDSFGRDRLHRRHRSESEDSVPHRRHSLRLDEKARTHDDADSNAKPKGKKNKKGKNASERLPSTTDKGKDPAARQATIPDVPVPPAHSLASTSSQPGSHPAASAPGRHGMGTKQTKKRSASRKRQKAKKKMAGLVNEGATRQMGLHPPLPLDQAHHPTHPPPVISVRPNNPSSSVPPPSLLQHALSGQNNWKALQQPSASAPAPAYPPPLYYRPHSAATHPPSTHYHAPPPIHYRPNMPADQFFPSTSFPRSTPSSQPSPAPSSQAFLGQVGYSDYPYRQS